MLLTPYESEVPMESLRQEVKSFVDGCEHLLALGSAESLSAQEFERIDHYLLEVEKFCAMMSLFWVCVGWMLRSFRRNSCLPFGAECAIGR